MMVTRAKTTSLTSGPARPLNWPFTTSPPLRGRPLRPSLAPPRLASALAPLLARWRSLRCSLAVGSVPRCDAHSSEHHVLSPQERREGGGAEVGDVLGVRAALVRENAAHEVEFRRRAGQDAGQRVPRLRRGHVVRVSTVIGSTAVAGRLRALGALRGVDAVLERVRAVVLAGLGLPDLGVDVLQPAA